MSTSTTSSTAGLPAEVLEQRAAEQRRRIHNSVSELKSSVRETVRERLDVKRYARAYMWPAVGVVSLIALAAGYGVTGAFTRH
jgi:hypothetical protein